MTRTLAGVHDPATPPGAHAVGQALDQARRARVESSGPLAVAWTGADAGGDGGAPADGGLLCLVDGWVWNVEALASSLGLAGAAPETVVAAAYRRLGDAVVERLRGEFALLLWDRDARHGLLARDRLGTRPLFLCSQGGRLCFASEIRDLLRLLPRRPGPDRAAVLHWLVGGSPRGERTLYEGIVALEPGSWVRLADERLERCRYWAPRFSGTLELAPDELVPRLRHEIGAAVRRSLVGAAAASGGESAGILLSGGLDSASVAGVAAAAGLEPEAAPAAYSAVFPDHPSADESVLIDRLTAELRLRSVRLEVHGGTMVGGALEYLRDWQLPLMDQNNFFMQPLLRRAAAQGVALMLDGEGGDELFGAARGLIADRLRRGRPLAALRLTGRLPGAGDSPPWRPLARLFVTHGVRGALPHRLHLAARRARGIERFAPPWFTHESARLLFDTDDPWAWKSVSGPRWWAQLADSLTRGVAARGVHDHARRRAQMAGLEARHPFLDAELIDFVLRLPPALSFDPHRSRPLLRAAMGGLVPDEVRLRRRKTYFDAPFYEAMAGHDREVVRRVVLDPSAQLGAYVDLARVRRELLDVSPSGHPLGARFWTGSCWRLVTAECWLRSQADPGFAERALASWELREPHHVLGEASGAGGGAARRP